MEIFPLCRAKVCQDEEIDSRFALSWLLITKIIPLLLLHSPFSFLPLFLSTFLVSLAQTRSNSKRFCSKSFSLQDIYMEGGELDDTRDPSLGSFVLTTVVDAGRKNCCAIMAQFLAGIRNYSTELKETVRRGRRREKERSARINEKLDAK